MSTHPLSKLRPGHTPADTPIGFRYVETMARHRGEIHLVCSRSPTARNYWPPLEETHEGRVELARRVAAIASCGAGDVDGDEVLRIMIAWIAAEGIDNG